jgi:gamma-glutamyl-gamma-aminobutyrate hydrolase PuuD
MTPLIAVTCTRKIDGSWGAYDQGHFIDYAFCQYSRAVVACGGAPVLVPAACKREALDRILSAADGLLLTGGPDVHPKFYGEEQTPGLGDIDEPLDRMELSAAAAAWEADLPIFAVCRGIQVLNISRGGTVYLHGAAVATASGLQDGALRQALRDGGEDPDDPAKDHVADVPVWRASSGDEPRWPSPWGPGRPGWHSECAAMAITLLGSSVDLHGGGADLAFPHHAYEQALAEAVTGVRPFARRWMRVGLVHHDGHKMAKSTGNLVLVSDLLADHDAAAVRLMLVNRPWSQPWTYTAEELQTAADLVERLYSCAGQPDSGSAGLQAVAAALRNDLDVPAAVDIALDVGGSAARFALHVLGLDAAHR